MEDFLRALRQHLAGCVPQHLALYDVMAGEARFARAWLDEDLQHLPADAQVLEVGAGVFILACLLVREGFAITSIEPTGTGFGAFEELGAAILAFAARDGAVPAVIRSRAEDFRSDGRFMFAFSMNVMEHVESPGRVIAAVSAVLSPGGSYRFLCPNYLFPYEPHFNIPTFGSKALTAWLMSRRIVGNTTMDDPVGVWGSLNWITVPQVKRMAKEDPSLAVSFQRGTLVSMLERAGGDVDFSRRRASWMAAALGVLSRLGLLRLAALVPATLQPVMDVRLTVVPEPK